MSQRRSIVRWISACSAVPLLAVGLAASLPAGQTQAATTYTVYNSPAGSVDGSEILDITPDNRYALVVGRASNENRLYVVTIDRSNGLVASRVDLEPAVNPDSANPRVPSADPSSVAIHPSGNYAIITVRDGSAASNTATESPGVAVFVTIGSGGNVSLVNSPVLQLGIRPESVDIAPNGEYAVVSNEGSDGTATASGTISVIDLNPASPAGASVAATLTPQATGGSRPDPETVVVSPNSAQAYVTLQTPGDIAIVNVNNGNLGDSTLTTVDLSSANSPDGVAVTPDSQYVMTANERTDNVTLYQLVAGPTLVPAGAVSTGANTTPEMLDVGTIGGVTKVAVSLEESDSVAILNLNLTAPANKLTLETTVPLNPGTAPFNSPAYGPEGIKIATVSSTLSYIVTANASRGGAPQSQNVSVIEARSDQVPTPTTPPTGPSPRGWLPIVFK